MWNGPEGIEIWVLRPDNVQLTWNYTIWKLRFQATIGLQWGRQIGTHGEGLMTRKRKKLRGTVAKIVKPLRPNQPEKAEIAIHEAEDLYREIRVENELVDEDGEKPVWSRARK